MKANIRYILSIILLCVFPVLFSGCLVVEKLNSWNGIHEPPPDWELAKLLEAEHAFYAENFPLAEELFNKVFDDSSNTVYVNQARYGLGCLRIAGAENTDELKKSFEMLSGWEEPGSEAVGLKKETPE